jgi:hypothetical protein
MLQTVSALKFDTIEPSRSPKTVFLVLGGFAAIFALCGISLITSANPQAQELVAKGEIRDRIRHQFCLDQAPCTIPDIHGSEWHLGPVVNGDRRWVVWVEASRQRSSTALKWNWKLTGTTRFLLDGTYYGPKNLAMMGWAGKSGIPKPPYVTPIDMSISPADAGARLDWVDKHWLTETVDNLRMEIRLTMLRGNQGSVATQGRSAATLIRLEVDRGDMNTAVNLIPTFALQYPHIKSEIKAEGIAQSTSPSLTPLYQDLFAKETAKL